MTVKTAHEARPRILGYIVIDENGTRHPQWSETCEDCGKPVRQMTGLRRPGGYGAGPVFWHAAPKPPADDPRRVRPRPEAWSRAISEGMRAANARRKEARQNSGS